jgi:hypothetical protein
MSELAPKAVMDRASRGRALFALLAAGLAAAVVFTPGEFGHYRRLLDPDPDPVVRAGMVLGVLSKTLAALALAGAPAAILFARGHTRAGLACGGVAGLLVLGYLGVDIEVQRFTGNSLLSYAAYLSEPDALRWAGEGFGVSGVLRAGLATSALALCVGSAVALAAHRLHSRRGRALGIAVAAWAILLPAGSIVQAGVAYALDYDSVRLLYLRLGETMPWSLPSGVVPIRDVQRESERLLSAYRAGMDRVSSPARVSVQTGGQRPNVVLVVLDSFRHDAFTPEVMPQLRTLAERGLRADSHYSGSNGSHYGFFSLMYGQSPVSYYPVIEAGHAPQWPSLLRSLGYRNVYLTGAEPGWLGMDRFLGDPHFDVSMHGAEGRDNWERDASVLLEAKRVLNESRDTPVFLVLFLLSTHYDYSYPDDPVHSVFEPALRPKLDEHEPGQREAILNGYRNTARYIDGVLGPWLEGLDPKENLIIVTGDHAESLWDDGTIMHSSRLSEVQTRVPLMMVGPGVPKGEVLTRLSTHEDVLPTLIDTLDLPGSTGSNLFGESLLREATRPSYVPLVQVKPPGYDHDWIALVTPDDRFGFTLDRLRGSIRFDGLLGANGLISSYRATPGQEALFLARLEDFFERVSRK